MSQVTRGVRAILSQPLVYDCFQAIMGAGRLRTEIADEFIRAKLGTRVLDVGCGTAEILSFLPDGIEYWGFDISSEYIDAAKRRHGSRGEFHQEALDRGDLVRLPKFDVVISIGVLHHLDDVEASELFRLAREAIAEGGRVITVDPCLAAGQNPIARFLIEHDRGQNVRTAEGYRSLATPAFGHVCGSIRHRSWIPYTHWMMECSL